jgi:DNA polymerase I
MQKLVLIDGHAILHRAYHALPPLTNAQGLQTNAVYGFTTMLLRIVGDLKPTHLVVAFDLPQPTFRQQQYTAYQGRRPEMESNLADQIPLLHGLLDALNIPHFALPGYEADDIIGTLAKQSSVETTIVTGDRDMLQLINQNTKVCVPVKGLSETKIYDEELVAQEFGVKPTQWVDVKALKGDASDNYPGVRGIGPKTAQSLITKYGSLENVYKSLKEIDKKTAAKLAEGIEDAGLAQKLARIVSDVPIHLDLEAAKTANINWSEGVKYMRAELGFKTLVTRIEKDFLKVASPEDPQIKLL